MYSIVLEQPCIKREKICWNLAEQMKAKCGIPIEKGPPNVYKLPVQQVMTDTTKHIAKYHIGKPDPAKQSPEKVLMVVGAIGAGKSTLINGMTNYILGVDWEDEFRFKVTVDEYMSQARCSLSWGSGRCLLEVYWGWTDSASAGDQEEVD